MRPRQSETEQQDQQVVGLPGPVDRPGLLSGLDCRSDLLRDIRHVTEIELDIACFATGLGGPDGRTLFMMCNDFKGPDKFDEMIASRTAKVLIADAPAPTAGWP